MASWKVYRNFYRPLRVNREGTVERQMEDGTWVSATTPRKNGSLYVNIRLKDGRYRSISVAKLVALSFIGLVPEYCQVVHLNGDRLDNRVENLKIVTAQESGRIGGRRNRRFSIRHEEVANEG